jgi:hypothetical protein
MHALYNVEMHVFMKEGKFSVVNSHHRHEGILIQRRLQLTPDHSHNMWFLDPVFNQNPIHRKRSGKSKNHPNLHHPPVNSRHSPEFPIEYRNLKNRHPSKQSNLKGSQRSDIGFSSANKTLHSPFSTHRCNREILE